LSDLLRSLNNRRISFAVLLAFLTSITAGLTGNLAHALTISEERELGEKLLSIVRAEFDLLDEPDLTQYTPLPPRPGSSFLMPVSSRP
jgi:hypothetical protein